MTATAATLFALALFLTNVSLTSTRLSTASAAATAASTREPILWPFTGSTSSIDRSSYSVIIAKSTNIVTHYIFQ